MSNTKLILENIKEAQNLETSPDRQIQLANSNSFLVRSTLRKNPNICDEAFELLNDDEGLTKLSNQIQSRIDDMYSDFNYNINTVISNNENIYEQLELDLEPQKRNKLLKKLKEIAGFEDRFDLQYYSPENVKHDLLAYTKEAGLKKPNKYENESFIEELLMERKIATITKEIRKKVAKQLPFLINELQNLDEAQNPEITQEHQIEIAQNSSFPIKVELLKNPNICLEAYNIIIDQILKSELENSEK